MYIETDFFFFFFRLTDDGSPNYDHLIPTVNISKVDYVFNPVADGNCGFRVIAHGIKGDEHQYNTIKKDMHDYLVQYSDWLVELGVHLQDDVEKMKHILQQRGSVGVEHWFYFPDCCQLAANTFLTPISFHSAENSILFLPITNFTYTSTKPIVLHLQFQHFTRIVYKRGARNLTYPTLYPIYETACGNGDINSRAHQY
jgi:hypothetical protein